ncbi:hypothetical protein CRENBAI_023464 [Crenichthys baileyi]|uniref:THD domain-containing protein n=1 Tax=Crenichthys baileyi TaxID=28760 RepID=A0AAV9R3H8_9TELE
MAVLADVKPRTGEGACEGRLSWPVFLLTLAAVTSSSLSALSLYQLVALRAEVEGLKTDISRRREEGQKVSHRSQSLYLGSELPSGPYTGIPWQAGLRRGTALEADGDRIIVKEAGFYFVYSQVYYMDSTFTMGHVVIRWKKDVVGNEDQDVHLFRCIQSMNPDYSFNTCYTGGVVKLERGDYLELLIPRAMANISLEGDSTFLGALKLT